MYEHDYGYENEKQTDAGPESSSGCGQLIAQELVAVVTTIVRRK